MVRSRRLPSSGIYAPVKNDGYGQEQMKSKLPSPQLKEKSTVSSAGAAHFTPIDALIGREKSGGGDRHHRSEPKKEALRSPSVPKKVEHGNVTVVKTLPKEDSTKSKAVAAESLVDAIGALNIGGKQPGVVVSSPQQRQMTSPNSTMNSGGVPPPSSQPTMAHPPPIGVSYSSQPSHQQMVGSAYTMGVGSGYGYPTTASYPMTAQPQLHYPNAPQYSQPPNMGYPSLQQGGYGYGYSGYVQQAAPGLVAPQSNYQLGYNPYYQMGGGSYTTPSQQGNTAPSSQTASYGQYGYGPYPTGTGYPQ